MALNKLDLISKVRRMRDVIDANATTNINSNINAVKLNHQPTKAPICKVNIRNGGTEKCVEDVRNEDDRLRTITRNNQTRKSVINSNNFSYDTNEQIRLNPTNETGESGGPKRPLVNQYNTNTTKASCHHHQHNTTNQHNETQIKQRETLPKKQVKENQSKEVSHLENNMPQSNHPTSSGAAATVEYSKTQRISTGPKQVPLNESLEQQQVVNGHYQQQHIHAPTCLASKLLVNGDHHNYIQSTQINQRFQHQPHCIYHNPNCPNNKQHQQRLVDETMAKVVFNQEQQTRACKHQQHQGSKYIQKSNRPHHDQDKYLLVEYHRQSPQTELRNNNNRSHLPESTTIAIDSGENSKSGSCRRTTIKFISQLYFLLHLSAVLSLLLHHKNLVISESKLSDNAQHHHIYTSPGAHLVKQSILVNDSIAPSTTQTPPLPPTGSNPLPIPLMLKATSEQAQTSHLRNNQPPNIISSVIVSPTQVSSSATGTLTSTSTVAGGTIQNNYNRLNFGRLTPAGSSLSYQTTVNYQLLSQTNHPDILVRLVGLAHARYALRYFLSYLLMTSVVVLVCLRLFRLCNWRRRRANYTNVANNNNNNSNNEQSSANQQQVNSAVTENYGFYQRTRLDCTPVLIGSISLGLIQLIVIGLDVAYNIDWLNESNHWPTSLPFLQFAFVSLLMQFILGKKIVVRSLTYWLLPVLLLTAAHELVPKTQVAKKHEQRKSVSSSSSPSLADGLSANNNNTKIVGDESNRRRQVAALSISNSGRRRYNNSNNNNNRAETLNSMGRGNEQSSLSNSNGSNSGFENIALAHLLVTHILLWLMKLNSISLFQAAVESQQHSNQHQHHQAAATRQQHQQQSGQRHHHHHQHHDQQSISNKLFPIHSADIVVGNIPSSGGYHETTDDFTGHHRVLTSGDSRHLLMNKPHLQPDEMKDKSRSQFEGKVYSIPQVTRAPNDQQPVVQVNSPSSSNDDNYNNLTTTSQPALNNMDAHSNKGERGHRSTGPLDRFGSLGGNTKGSETGYPNVRWAQYSPSLPRPINLQPSSGSPLTNITKPKSTIPKRMTAFRQRTPSSSFVSLANSVATTTTTVAPQISTSPPVDELPNQTKQRARVMIHRIEDPVHLESPETEAARRRRAKQVSLEHLMATTDRPFPSVESDPPILTATTPSSISEQTIAIKPTTMKAFVGKGKSLLGNGNDHETLASSIGLATNKTLKPTVVEPKTIKNQKNTTSGSGEKSTLSEGDEDDPTTSGGGVDLATEEESGSEDDIEESDIDLDSLLPPVPIYDEQSSSSSPLLPPEEEVKRKQLPPMTSKSKDFPQISRTNQTLKKKTFNSNEDAFAFNEAASEQVDSTIESPPPTPEALVMIAQKQQQQQNEKSQPTFADYLMPIVHQYHILIAAILFNMWLDGLRTVGLSRSKGTNSSGKVTQATYLHQDVSFSNKRLISSRDMLLAAAAASGSCSRSTSELDGSTDVSPSSSTRGLVAIPIRHHHHHHLHPNNHHQKRIEHAPESRYISPLSGFALDRFHKSSSHWRQLSDRHEHYYNQKYHHHHLHNHHHHQQQQQHYRSRSMDSLHQPTRELASSNESTLSRRHSVRSTSSQQLLWISGIPGRSRSPLLGRQVLAPFSQLRQTTTLAEAQQQARKGLDLRNQQPPASTSATAQMLSNNPSYSLLSTSLGRSQAANSVCSVFFGLIVVSITLIVILVGIDLLSIFTQCLTQLISIIVCLLGLLLIWRHKLRANKRKSNQERLCYRRRLLHLTEPQHRATKSSVGTQKLAQNKGQSTSGSHRQCFHYLFLLAAYYCGISIALNLSRQHSMQQLFSQQVVQFIHRYFHGSSTSTSSSSSSSSSRFMLHEPIVQAHHYATKPDYLVASIANYLFLFHLILIVKGLLLILQVTLQTLLIRSSCHRATKELRQIYTFLMFANLSLWALEICEQQQHLQRELESTTVIGNEVSGFSSDRYKLISLDSFTRFAASIVTLSHLYHGLVFMQQ